MHNDAIHLNGLQISCRIGVTPAERRRARRLEAGVTLYTSLDRAGKSDKLCDTVDYAALTTRIRAAAGAREWTLIEALASGIAEVCLEEPRVTAVRVMVVKPAPCKGLAGAAVEILRKRPSLIKETS